MADASSTIAVIFEAFDKATPTIDGIERRLGAMSAAADAATKAFGGVAGNIQSATQPLADLTAGVLKVEGAFIGAGVALTTFAIKTAGDFDTAFRQITTLFNASEQDVAKFRANILEYARTSSKGLEDITNALGAAIGSGVDYTKSLDLIATAEKLAVSTRADLKGTTEVLVSTLNAYGMKTSDAGKVSDLFFQIIKDGKIEMGDLAHSLSMVTPLAAASGVSLQEVGAAIAALTASGISPSQSIEYLRSALTNIIKPSKDASDLAAELNIQFDAQALKSKGLAGVLGDVARATNGNSGQMAKLIGDVGGLVAAMALTGPAADKFKESLAGMAKSAGAVDEAFGKMGGSLDVATAKAANAFKTLLVDIGTPLLNEAGGIANAIANIFNAIGASVREGALKEVVRYVESALGDLQATLETVARNLPAALGKADLSGFTRGLDTVRDAFSRLFGSINLTSVDGLTKAIELAGTAFLGLSKFTAGVIDSFKPLFDLLVRWGSELGKTNPQVFEMAGQISGLATQANLLAGKMVSLLPAFEALIDLILLRQGIGLLGSLSNLTKALPAMTGGITGLGVAITTYLASEKVIALVQALVEWKKATDLVAEANARSADVTNRAGPSLERFAQTTGIAVKTIDEANALMRDGTVVWSDAIDGWVKADDALAGVGKAAAGAVNPFEKANQAMLDAVSGAGKMANAADGVGKNVLKTVPIIDAATGAIVGYEQKMVRVQGATDKAAEASTKKAKALDEVAKEAKKAQEKADAFRVEMEKLASNERIKFMEFRAQLDIANIQEQTKRIQSAFDSIDNTVNSTADVINEAFGFLTDSDSWLMSSSTKSLLVQQIETENRNRERALQVQERMVDAQIDLMKQQAEALSRGDALIKVDGTGLEPELEAFMWKIFQRAQVRVNRDGLKQLLGV